jgi:hypothetical protein
MVKKALRKNDEEKFHQQIYQEVQRFLQFDDINEIFLSLAKAKHGEKSDSPKLTSVEKLLFCLDYGCYSYLERGFIRSFQRKPTDNEKSIYIKLCNEINIKEEDSLNKREREQQNYSEYQVISALIKNIRDRSPMSDINGWLKIVLEVEKLPDQWAIVEMLRKKCKKINSDQ